MKRLIVATLFIMAFVLSSSTALAAHYWQITISDPTTTDQTRTFNLDYAALSTSKEDKITVKLLQDGSIIGTQTTIAGGDSGSFAIVVPSDGTFAYRFDASSTDDGSSKSTSTKVVSVVTPVEGQPSEVTTTTTDQLNIGAGTDNINQGVNNDEETDSGEVRGVTDEPGGAVSDEAAVDEKSNDSGSNTLQYAIGAIVVLGIGWYLYTYYKASKIQE